MAVALPGRESLPDGPFRRLITAIHDLYNDAGRPGLRQISTAIRRRNDLRDTVSHETISSTLRGDALPRWQKLECLVRVLATWAVSRPDADAEVRRFHAMWLEADDATGTVAARHQVPDSPAEDGHVTRSRPPSEPAPSGTVISNAPARNPTFVGRVETLDRMRNLLRASPRRPLVLRGIGGVGKTQLATEYIHLHADEYELVWWIPSAELAQARAAFAVLADRLGLPRSWDLAQTAQHTLGELENSSLRWLLVFDNVDDPVAIGTMLPSGGDVIATTRVLGWPRTCEVLEVDVFHRAESVELVCQRGNDIAPVEADELAAQLGDLPLALEHVAAVQSETGMPVTEYLRLYAEHMSDLLTTRPEQDHPTSVVAFVTLAMSSLRQRTPAAAQLFELFAHLGSEPVPVSLFRISQGADIPAPLGRAVFQFDFIERVVGQLVRYGVARLEPRSQRIQVHRLIRSVLREQLEPERTAEVRATIHRLLGAANPGRPDDPSTWSLHADIGPHLIASDAVHSDDLAVRQAVVDQIRYLERRGDYHESRRLGDLATDVWRRRPDDESLDHTEDELTYRVIRETANAMRALGSYAEARRLTEDALDRLRNSPAHGEDDPLTLDLAGAVGVYLRITGAYAEAEAIDRDLVERRERLNGADYPATLRAFGNLAVSLRMNGRFSEAYSVDIRVHDAFRRRFGENDPRVLLAAANLAKDLHGLGQYQKCLDEIERVLPVQISLHGGNHEYVLWSTRMRAIGLRRTGQHAEAVRVASANVRNVERNFGPVHETTLLSMITHANALRATGDLDGAKEVAGESLARLRNAFGPYNPVTLAAATNFAVILRMMGIRSEAIAIDRATVRALIASVGEKHPYTLIALNGLAIDLMLTGQHEDALTLSRSVVARATDTLGQEHPVTKAFEANLSPDRASATRNTGPSEPRRVEVDIEPPES
jgi:tetratricopeptide (TPR) repeat protein